MPDRLVIHEIAAECRLGVYAWEQERPQTIWIDLELTIDAARAAAQDDVRQAIDYAKLVDAVKQLVGREPYHLLETVAGRVAAMILEQFETTTVTVQVRKRALAGIGYAAVEVERTAARSRRRPRAGRSTRRLVKAGTRR